MNYSQISKHIIGAFALSICAATSYAAAFPTKTITLIVPYTSGGTADAIGRNLAQSLSKQLKTPVIVENKAGAGASLGTDYVAKSTADGHTLLLVSTSALTIYPHIAKANYDPLLDLIPLASVAIAPVALAATKATPVKDFSALMAQAKAKPESIRYGTPGVGTNAHLGMELLSEETSAKLLHIPYKGNSQALTDAIGGTFELLVTNVDVVLPHAKTGVLRPLAVMAPTRLDFWPDVPTLAELGYPAAQYYSDFGIFLPAKTPANVVTVLQAAIQEAIARPEYAKFLQNSATQPGVGTGAEYAKKIQQQYQTNADIIKKANISVN